MKHPTKHHRAPPPLFFDARRLMPSIRRAAAWLAARPVRRIQHRPARLTEERMADWQLRDLGFRDGRAAPVRKDEFG